MNEQQPGMNSTAELQHDQSTMPLGVGEFNGDDTLDPLLGGSEGNRKMRSSGVLLIVIVIILAAAGLLSMRGLAKATAGISSDADLEQTIEGFLKTIVGKTETADESTDARIVNLSDLRVLRVLHDNYTEQQVELRDVQRNPFIIFNEIGSSLTGDADRHSIDPSMMSLHRKRAARTAEVEQAADRLMLKSVLMGSTPLANISGRILQTDETLMVEPEMIEFRVVGIEKDSITIVSVDDALDLTVESTIYIQQP